MRPAQALDFSAAPLFVQAARFGGNAGPCLFARFRLVGRLAEQISQAQQGIGAVAATGHEIWNNAPEKVLGVTEAWHNHHPATHLRLRIAIMAACQALAEPAQRERAAQILSQAQYLGLPAKVLKD